MGGHWRREQTALVGQGYAIETCGTPERTMSNWMHNHL